MFFSFSLSSQFGKNSSWIMFLEEDTRVKLPKLHEVLKNIDHRKVRTFHTVLNVIKIHICPLIDVPQSARVEIVFSNFACSFACSCPHRWNLTQNK